MAKIVAGTVAQIPQCNSPSMHLRPNHGINVTLFRKFLPLFMYFRYVKYAIISKKSFSVDFPGDNIALIFSSCEHLENDLKSHGAAKKRSFLDLNCLSIYTLINIFNHEFDFLILHAVFYILCNFE